MHLDIRTPIGLMFSLLGAILTIYGLLTSSDKAAYVNLWWGLFILLFGAVMLLLARRSKKTHPSQTPAQPIKEEVTTP